MLPHYNPAKQERYQAAITRLTDEASPENTSYAAAALAATALRYVNLNLDLAEYTQTEPAPKPHSTLVLVNKFCHLEKSFVPDDLVKVTSKYAARTGMKLQRETYRAYRVMNEAAGKAGMKLRITSAYRSFTEQNAIYNSFAKRYGTNAAKTRAALPGYSEHQTGLAVDLSGSHSSFGKSREYQWLLQNAHRYGFICRYTADNAYLTRYIDEPWHWRYVGIQAATEIHEQQVGSLEEYLEELPPLVASP